MSGTPAIYRYDENENLYKAGGMEQLLPIGYTLLWTNPSPDAAFAAQTVSLDLTDYDIIKVYFRRSNASGDIMIYSEDGMVKGTTWNYVVCIGVGAGSSGTLASRQFNFSDTGVNFLVGGTGVQIDNNRAIPIWIFGMKKPSASKAVTADQISYEDGSVADALDDVTSDLTELETSLSVTSMPFSNATWLDGSNSHIIRFGKLRILTIFAKNGAAWSTGPTQVITLYDIDRPSTTVYYDTTAYNGVPTRINILPDGAVNIWMATATTTSNTIWTVVYIVD